MKQFGRAIVKLRYIILAVAIALLIPAAIGYMHTKINYDMLVYLPQDIDTMKGQDILKDEFGTGAFASYIVKGMSEKQVSDLKAEIEKVPHVKKVLWYDSVMDLSVPMQMLPDDIYEAFNSGDSTMMFIIFDQTTSEDGTVAAVRQIRKLSNEKCFLAGMTATLVDTENLSDKEAPTYVGLAVLLSVIVLSLTMDSYLVPFVFLASIGMAIIYNLGTNLFLGHISYITKSLAAVLQLGVTMDYSIFLWHSYEDYQDAGKERKEAMALLDHGLLDHDDRGLHRPVLHELQARPRPRSCHGEGCSVRRCFVHHNPSVADPDFRQSAREDKTQSATAGYQGHRPFRDKTLQSVHGTLLSAACSGTVRIQSHEAVL